MHQREKAARDAPHNRLANSAGSSGGIQAVGPVASENGSEKPQPARQMPPCGVSCGERERYLS
jgi:hypothetical protein